MKTAQWKLATPVGDLYLVASEKGLRYVTFKQSSKAPMIQSLDHSEPEILILAEAARQLNEYFSGLRRVFDLPLDPEIGTEFQKNVWKQLSTIPYGQTLSYKDLATKVNSAKAVRAVGAANGKNPLGIVVPCHRVIGSNGTLTGYAGGLKMKTQLLQLEEANFRD